MLIDDVVITLKGGNGGNGAISFRQNEGSAKGGPDGGNGGNGGDVYFVGVDDLTALQPFQHKKEWKAEDGVNGKYKNLFGKNGSDLFITVPIGTRLSDSKGNYIAEIQRVNVPFLVVRGGKGGKGNNEFKSSTRQAPRYAERGKPGEEKTLHLELRLIAQIGLVGLPNAGKSTLLSVLTNAHPKIGNYPFTTLEPNVGVMDEVIIADIPGLIEGASTGKGLGFKFLKHIEKTELLVHCIDITSDDVLLDYEVIRKEFGLYNPTLLEKPEIIVLTKVDEVEEEKIKRVMKELKKTKRQLLSVTAYDDSQVNLLRDVIKKEHKSLTRSSVDVDAS